MDKIKERSVDRNNATITREQHETRWTENGRLRRVTVQARTPHAEENNPETTRKVTIKNGAVTVHKRERKRAGYAHDDMMLQRAINEARLDFQTTLNDIK